MAVHIIDRDWERFPPSKRPRNLYDLVSDFYRLRYTPESLTATREDDIYQWCAEAPSLRAAIIRAVVSKRPNGRKHNHQSRVFTLREYRRAMLREYDQIKSVTDAGDFHDLWRLCQKIAVPGIGPVTIYDVTWRISAYVNLYPVYLYLHAHPRQSVEKLLGRSTRGMEFIDPAELPSPLDIMDVGDLEDFLCLYASKFSPRIRRSIRNGGNRLPD